MQVTTTTDGDSDDQFLWYLLSRKREDEKESRSRVRRKEMRQSRMQSNILLDTKCVIYANTTRNELPCGLGRGNARKWKKRRSKKLSKVTRRKISSKKSRAIFQLESSICLVEM